MLLAIFAAAALAAQPVPPVLPVAPMSDRPAPQATAAAPAATAAAPSLTLIERPDWVRKPGGDSAARYFPDRAARLGIDGRVVMLCHVRNDGLLAQCEILEETPSGYDFGAAALKMAPLFRMRPLDTSKFNVPGDSGFTVRVPLAFLSPHDPPPPPVDLVTPLTFDEAVMCHAVFTRRVRYMRQIGDKPWVAAARTLAIRLGAAEGLSSRAVNGALRDGLKTRIQEDDRRCQIISGRPLY